MNKKSVLALSKVIFIKILITFFSVCFSTFCLLFQKKLYLNDSVCVQMGMGHDQKWNGCLSVPFQMNRDDRDDVCVRRRVPNPLSKVRFHGLSSCHRALEFCKENGKHIKYNSPVSSQEDVNQMFNKIQNLSGQDQLSVIRKEIKLKKILSFWSPI